MKKPTRWVGLDVHAQTIAVAVAEKEGEVRSLGIVPNTPESLRKVFQKLGKPEELRACYEAGPTGYVTYWQLSKLGVACEVVAPTLMPTKPGDRVKTDRRDAMRLARSFRSGDLTPVWVPDAAHEALRDLVRAREAAKRDQLRARHRLGKFLLRRGLRAPEGMSAWTEKHLEWVRKLHFEQPAQSATCADYLCEVEHAGERIKRLDSAIDEAVAHAPEQMRAVIEALQALRGVAKVTAVTLVAEIGQMSRFQKATQLMGYSGAVPREHSSGESIHRGPITKTGNAHLRRVILEASWAYQHRPKLYEALRRRQRGVDEKTKEIAWKAQHRLNDRYQRLSGRGKPKAKAITAVARELLGFIWAIGTHVEKEFDQRTGRSNLAA